ncbi:uncharacterized protein LOC108223027 isoform X2 [Daucus carota subsp. sativus]|uniref:uncharacterized protein LOC108223027 isoform X2 n=1 Tax=Daucus carota subsp. sativus TaxID=79200 RepID=UPI0007F030BA|nr:PREDICTED: CCR4-NOT transcription complex subunit 3-like isoform X2 [Daucus carota subsp. sativus]
MGASRKLQGEIDRVLKKVQEGVDVFDSIWNKVYDTDNANQKEKFEADLKKEIKKLQRYRDQIKTWIQSSEIKDKKVSASYEQALMDARKLIEREMERFKICEKETKTKAFSKEGLGQQPKTDPKEKAKSETRDWLNNVVSELESQIDSFEAEMEGLTVKKGKTRPPRLTHLEASITRHKAHIMKLELILRLLDNDELSPDQVNDVKDFLDDYVERNQEDFEEFNDVDELYISLPLEKVESLEDLVTIPPGLVKGVGATSAILSLKPSLTTSSAQLPAALTSTDQPSSSVLEQVEETVFQDSTSDVPKTPSSKSTAVGASAPTPPTGSHTTGIPNNTAHILPGMSTASAIQSGPSPAKGMLEIASAVVSSAPVSISVSTKEEEFTGSPGRKSSPALSETGLRGVGRGSLSSPLSTANPPSSGSTIPNNGAFGALTPASEIAKRNMVGADERLAGTGIVQPLDSPLSNRIMLSHAAKAFDGINMTENGNLGEAAGISPRIFSPGMQWRPGSSFQNQNEVGQLRGRTEIAPDQREKFLQRLQQVQQGQSTMLGMPPLAGENHKQFSSQQHNSLLQQSSAASPQVGLGIGVQAPSVSTVTSASLQQQPNPTLQQQFSQHGPMSTSLKDSDVGHAKVDELQHQPNVSDDSAAESSPRTGVVKNLMNEDDIKASYALDTPGGVTGSSTEAAQMPRDVDLSPGQPLQSNQSSGSLGVIGRRSVSDLGAIGGPSLNSAGMHDQLYNLQMLESAYYKLPQPKDSERAKSYTPRHPAITPSSYPQVQAPIVNNPAFWERLGADNYGTDTLFFAFYYQQNTYQQYLAAKELKKQSWRFHKKYNTWFQRHEEPKLATDDYEQGTYVYFDFHISDESQHGWCQRIKTEFRFEYNYLEDELIV